MGHVYQVFISFKHLDDSGKPTIDAQLAEEFYRFTSDRGLSVLLSSVSLEDLGIATYKKAIDDALDSAQVLLPWAPPVRISSRSGFVKSGTASSTIF
jgi:hypothetical protein